MAVVDLLEEQDQLIAHQYEFYLWPKLWSQYALPDPLKWEIHPFQANQEKNIPNEPGIYSFIIQPGVASHPRCSYLMYIGKTERTLQERFREYLSEERRETGRPKIVRLLNKYQGYLYFCCSVIVTTDRIGDIEKALLTAFLPPCNEEFPVEVRRIIGALQ